MREIGIKEWSKEVYQSNDMLLNFEVIGENDLNKSLTYLWCQSSNDFPLLGMTEGVGLTQNVKRLNNGDSQYKWRVVGKPTRTTQVVGLRTQTTQAGIGYSTFLVEFKDNQAAFMYTLISPDGRHQCRAQGEGEQLSSGGYLYELILMTGDRDEFVELSNFEQGLSWAIGATTVGDKLSTGTSDREESFSEVTNQFGYHRFSKQITGNFANQVVEYTLDTTGGSLEKLWIPYAMYKFEYKRKCELEEDLWYSVYNRDTQGVIHNRDKATQVKLPKGAGVKDILMSIGNYFPFSRMTVQLFDFIIARIWDARPDESVPDNLVLYTGQGGKRMFQECIKREAIDRGYFTALGENEMYERNGLFTFGKYFEQYKTESGAYVTLRLNGIFDRGARATMQRENGWVYKAFPYISYTMVYLNHRVNNSGGEANITLVTEQGRENIWGVYRGITPLPASWGGYGGSSVDGQMKSLGLLSTRQDFASYEVFTSQGINILDPTLCFWAEFQPE